MPSSPKSVVYVLKLSDLSINSIDLAVALSSSMSRGDGRFAGVAAHLVFLFIPRPVVALREMQRVTRPGGTVAAVVWDSRGGLVFQRMMWDTAVAIDPNARVARNNLFANPVAIPGGLAGFFNEAGVTKID